MSIFAELIRRERQLGGRSAWPSSAPAGSAAGLCAEWQRARHDTSSGGEPYAGARRTRTRKRRPARGPHPRVRRCGELLASRSRTDARWQPRGSNFLHWSQLSTSSWRQPATSLSAPRLPGTRSHTASTSWPPTLRRSAPSDAIFKRLADEAGVVYSDVDGDQGGILSELYDYCTGLGLEPVGGGQLQRRAQTLRNARDTSSVLGRDRHQTMDRQRRGRRHQGQHGDGHRCERHGYAPVVRAWSVRRPRSRPC